VRAGPDWRACTNSLAAVNSSGADSTVQALTRVPVRLLANARIGEQLLQCQLGKVRGILVGQYEIRYEIVKQTVSVLRLWHRQEDR